MDNTRKTVGQGFDVPIRYKANLTIDEAVEYMKAAIKKTYGKKEGF